MSKSNYLENKDLDHRYGGPDFARPATVYFQLHDSDPGETGTGGTGLASVGRAAVTNNATNFPAASGGVKTNGLAISWGSTAGQNSLPASTHFSIWDAASGGNLLDYGTLVLAVADREDVNIPAGQLSITET